MLSELSEEQKQQFAKETEEAKVYLKSSEDIVRRYVVELRE